MRATSILALARILAAASFGTSPASASVSVAASSTSSHFAYLLASRHTAPICSRVYRGINLGSLISVRAADLRSGFPQAGSTRKSMVQIHGNDTVFQTTMRLAEALSLKPLQGHRLQPVTDRH